jgi:hypothetical protein
MLTCAYPAQAGINVWTKCGPDMRFTILVIDPITPRTIYAGSGFNHPGSANPTVFKSTDGCCSWQAANGGLSAISKVDGAACTKTDGRWARRGGVSRFRFPPGV